MISGDTRWGELQSRRPRLKREATMIAFDEEKYPVSKRVGVVSEVTLITPIKRGRVEGEYRTYRQRLENVLDDVQQRELADLPTPVSLLRQIHFARWVILDAPGRAGDLLFTSNFDGDMKLYFRNFALELTGDIDRVWSNCEGYPGARDFDRLWRYVKEHQINTRLFYSAYPMLTMPEIERLDALRKGFGEFLRKEGRRLQSPEEIARNAESLAKDFTGLLESARLEKPPVAPEQPDRACGRRAKSRELERSRIQANVLGSPPWKQAGYYFLRIDDAQAFRKGLWNLLSLGERIGFVTADHFERHRRTKGLTKALNIAFTWSGLKALGLAEEYLDGMPLAFRQGMAERAAILDDVGDWAPNRWEGALGRKDIHVLVAASCDAGDVAEYWEQIRKAAQGGAQPESCADFIGCALIHQELGERIEKNPEVRESEAKEQLLAKRFVLPEGAGQPEIEGAGPTQAPPASASAAGGSEANERFFYEPFGFRDGVGQPEIEGADPAQAPTARAIAAGEFILGYPDVDGNDQIAEDFVGAPFRALCDNGTYMVFRKIEQHVTAFEEALGKGDLATRAIGRRRDGVSLVVDKPPSLGDIDAFDYRDDPDGLKCPFASHARRVNPRNDESRRHRIIRRGIPYKDGNKQGMLFVCFNARIETQFEFLQSEWCRKGDFLGYFTEARDPAVGGGGSFVDPRTPLPYSLNSFVTVKGGDYFFLPGMAALDGVVHGAFDAPTTALPLPQATVQASPESFDPVSYAGDGALIADLLTNRRIEARRVAWPSGRRQAVYYVACRDHLRKILADDATFTSAQYARKLEGLLHDYDYGAWLRPGEKKGPEHLLFQRFMLGMSADDPEKEARRLILSRAFAASTLEEVRKGIGDCVGPIARAVVASAIRMGENSGGFDLVNPIGYGVPLACAVKHFGFPNLKGFSDAYKALYFERTSIAEVRGLGFLQEFPKGAALSALPPELFALAHAIAVFLLIDQYDTPSTLELARVAVKEFLNRLGEEVLAEQDRIAAGSPYPTLLSRLLQSPAEGVDPITFRVRVGMIVAELVVGGVDTTAKGITNVVDCLLSNPQALQLAQKAVHANDDQTLDNIILEALRLEPVADLIVRECPKGAVLALSNGAFQFEAGSRLFLIPPAAMRDPGADPLPSGVDLGKFVLSQAEDVRRALDPIRRLAFGDGPHGCLGTEMVVSEIREVLKQLVRLKNLRRAAGPTGQKQESLDLPVSLDVRFDP
jgi:Dyp-type peroxidase family